MARKLGFGMMFILGLLIYVFPFRGFFLSLSKNISWWGPSVLGKGMFEFEISGGFGSFFFLGRGAPRRFNYFYSRDC